MNLPRVLIASALAVVILIGISYIPACGGGPSDVNVKEFGALGDGVHDDTSSILLAIEASDGGHVYFPVGTYSVTQMPPTASFCGQVVGTGPGVKRSMIKTVKGGVYTFRFIEPCY